MRATTRYVVWAVLGAVVGIAGGHFIANLLVGEAWARPQTGLVLDWLNNGEARRWRMADAGWSGTFGSGVQCMAVQDSTAAGCSVIELYPSAAAFLCMGQASDSATGPWDGGCVTTPTTDPNYGEPLAATTLKKVVLQPTTSTICIVPSTGSVNMPVWCMR